MSVDRWALTQSSRGSMNEKRGSWEIATSNQATERARVQQATERVCTTASDRECAPQQATERVCTTASDRESARTASDREEERIEQATENTREAREVTRGTDMWEKSHRSI